MGEVDEKLEQGEQVAAVLCPAAQSLEGKVKDMPGGMIYKVSLSEPDGGTRQGEIRGEGGTNLGPL